MTQSVPPSFQEQVLTALAELNKGQTTLTEGQAELTKNQAGLAQNQITLTNGYNQLRELHIDLKTDVQKLVLGQEILTNEIMNLRVEFSHLSGRVGTLEDKVDQILDAYAPQIEKNTEQDKRLDNHGQTLASHEATLHKLTTKPA